MRISGHTTQLQILEYSQLLPVCVWTCFRYVPGMPWLRPKVQGLKVSGLKVSGLKVLGPVFLGCQVLRNYYLATKFEIPQLLPNLGGVWKRFRYVLDMPWLGPKVRGLKVSGLKVSGLKVSVNVCLGCQVLRQYYLAINFESFQFLYNPCGMWRGSIYAACQSSPSVDARIFVTLIEKRKFNFSLV